MGTAMVVVFGLALVWFLGSGFLRGLAWLFLILSVLAAIVGVGVPVSVGIFALVCWLAGHAIFRARHGYWESRLLGGAVNWAARPRRVR